VPGISEALEGQLNAKEHHRVKIVGGTQLAKAASLLENKLPIEISVSLVRKNVAPRVKSEIGKVAASFEKQDKITVIRALVSGTFPLVYDGKEVELSPSDVEIAYKATEGYSLAERGDLIVLISTERDRSLIYDGLLRDLARQLQQLRKERQYNPTEILGAAYIAGLDDDEVSALSAMKDKLLYLVRVKDVILSKERVEGVDYKTVEIDGREFSFSVQ
jgi:isoleucyl-tRNA synthetase